MPVSIKQRHSRVSVLVTGTRPLSPLSDYRPKSSYGIRRSFTAAQRVRSVSIRMNRPGAEVKTAPEA